MLEEGVAGTATIDEAAKKTFGIGMGPFELMNVTGVPIALHAATTLGRAFGPLYERAGAASSAGRVGTAVAIDGTPSTRDCSRSSAIGSRRRCSSSPRARRRRRRHDRGHRHRRARRPALAARAVRADESVRRRPRARPGRRACRALAAAVPARLAEQARTAEPFRSAWCAREIADGIATLTINRPDALNAINEEVVGQLEQAFAAAAADPEVEGHRDRRRRQGVHRRRGHPLLRPQHRDGQASTASPRSPSAAQALLRAIETCAKPVVARVHGMALGGGVELALACHAIVATPKATFAFPETGIGIYPGLGGTQRTTSRIGKGLAKWLVLTGETIGAEEAAAIGLIDKVVPYEELDAAIADAIAAGPVGERTPTTIPPSHVAIAAYFERPDNAAPRQSGTAVPDDPRIAKTAKRMAVKAPIALRIAADLIDQERTCRLPTAYVWSWRTCERSSRRRTPMKGCRASEKKPPVFTGSVVTRPHRPSTASARPHLRRRAAARRQPGRCERRGCASTS